MSGPLGLASGGRDGVVQVPPVLPRGTMPLLLFLHGATQSGAGTLRRISAAADQAGVAVLAPDSRGTTWDAIRNGFGEDVAFLNRALDHVFARLAGRPCARRRRRLFRRRVVRPLARARQRRPVPAGRRLFTRLRHQRAGARAGARVCLARQVRSDSSDRPVQPHHRAAASLRGV